jgi:flagellin-like hook-associated protein FlgL
MPIVVNSNTTATIASFNLSSASDALRKSLNRLSSGNRIVSPADDAGGLSVAYKLNSKLQRTEAVRQNIQSGISYLQVQDGAMTTVAKIVDRMAELRTMASDVTKNTQDVENYSKEFIELQRQLNQVRREKFNGISLFSVSRTMAVNTPPDLRPQLSKDDAVDDEGRSYKSFARNILTTADGVKEDGNVDLNVINFQHLLSLGKIDTRYITTETASNIDYQKTQNVSIGGAGATGDTTGQNIFINLGNVNNGNLNDFDSDSAGTAGHPSSASLAASFNEIYTSDGFLKSIMFVDIESYTDIIQRIADARAENGAEQNRLGMVNELLIQNQTNLEAAYGRIMDADMALESTRFARQNVLVQSSAAMVAQANQLTSIALTLLG